LVDPGHAWCPWRRVGRRTGRVGAGPTPTWRPWPSSQRASRLLAHVDRANRQRPSPAGVTVEEWRAEWVTSHGLHKRW